MFKSGLPTRRVAAIFGVAYSTMSMFIVWFYATNSVTCTCNGHSRPKATTHRQDNLIRTLTLRNRTITVRALQISKGAKIRNRYNQVPHLTQDTNGKVTNSQSDTANGQLFPSRCPQGIYKQTRTKAYQTQYRKKDPQGQPQTAAGVTVSDHVCMLQA